MWLGVAICFSVLVLLLGRRRVFPIFLFLLRRCWLLGLLGLSWLVVFLLRVATGRAIGAFSLAVDLKLAGTFDDIVAGSLDVYGWVVGRGVLLDGVAAIRLNGDLALLLDLGNLTTRLTAAPVP